MNHYRRELSEIIADRDDIEAMNQAAAKPRPVTTAIRHVNPALLGTKADRDAFADSMLAQERQHNLDAEAEQNSEGRCHVNIRPDRTGP